MLTILADENIPYVQEAFGALGQVRLCSGRAVTAAMVREADVLLVRSVTQVNEALLGESPVKFVGTATIGTDHIDTSYLARRGIRFSSAAGSNSNSVAEYVMTVLLVLAERHGWDLAGKTLGIIGVGNIGTQAAFKARALGMNVLLNDPPKQRETGDTKYVSLEETLQADFITCHVPLTKTGPDATFHLLDSDRLSKLRKETVVINSSRGAVVDNQALKRCLGEKRFRGAVLDVWEHEPSIDAELLERVEIGTPHIAGYSFDGKVNGTVMLYEAVCQMLGRPAMLKSEDLLPPPAVERLTLHTANKSDQTLLYEALTAIYDLYGDDTRMRKLLGVPSAEQGRFFDTLRKTYPVRRESHTMHIDLDRARPELAAKLACLGFLL